MKWYTKNDRLCLGTDKQLFTNFHVTTQVKFQSEFSTPLLEEHIKLIGSYPEDWRSDKTIASKINNTAKHFFGFYQSQIA